MRKLSCSVLPLVFVLPQIRLRTSSNEMKSPKSLQLSLCWVLIYVVSGPCAHAGTYTLFPQLYGESVIVIVLSSFHGWRNKSIHYFVFLPEIQICSLFFALAVSYPVSSVFPVVPSMHLCAMGNLKRFLVAYRLYNEMWEWERASLVLGWGKRECRLSGYPPLAIIATCEPPVW